MSSRLTTISPVATQNGWAEIYKFLGSASAPSCMASTTISAARPTPPTLPTGTNNEFGFDYLRDNMKYELAQMVQRPHSSPSSTKWTPSSSTRARTPLIISGPSEDKSDLYNSIDRLIPKLVREDYDLDEKQRTVNLTEAGNEHMDELMRAAGVLGDGSLYDASNVTLVHHVQQALKAHTLFQRDKDYIVRNGEVVIIDEFTGRMMPGRRFSEGLHQALEAKEHVAVQPRT